MKHLLGHRSAASAAAFLEQDSEADKELMAVTGEVVFWEYLMDISCYGFFYFS